MSLRKKVLQNFRCQGCGKCCKRNKGIVYINIEEAKSIAKILDKPLFLFLQENCKKQRGWLVLSDDRFNPKCYLDEKNRCKIYEARPKYCRDYPFVRDILKSDKTILEESKFCPGIASALQL